MRPTADGGGAAEVASPAADAAVDSASDASPTVPCAGVGCACDGPASCDDGNPCTANTCAGTCAFVAVDGLWCDADGSACTAADACKGGACAPGKLKACDDGNPCTVDGCAIATGCVHAADPGAPCSDGNACTAADTCQGPSCSGGALVACGDDGLPCTATVCDPTTGCSWLPLAATCSDGDACTTGDHCAGKLCVGAPAGATACDDGNACTADACAPPKGCTATAVADGKPCGATGACQAGACAAKAKCGDKVVAAPEQCDDGNVADGDGCNAMCFEEPQSGMVAIPAGAFFMGCNAAADGGCNPNELPQHQVQLSAFAIDRTEVTVAAYAACVAAGKCQPAPSGYVYCNTGKPGHDQHPINCVDWFAAKAYCAWAGKRLPTEAEWERAARGGCEFAAGASCAQAMPTWPWGNQQVSCDYAVFHETSVGCGLNGTAPVGSRPKGRSPFGVDDMAGNIWEWVADPYDAGYYAASPAVDPQGPPLGQVHVLRGGCFGIFAQFTRAALRATVDGGLGGTFYGFRCAKTL